MTKAFTYSFKQLCIVLLLVFACVLNAFSQTISTRINKDKIVIGESFELIFVAQIPATVNLPTVNWLQIPDSFQTFELIELHKIDTIKAGGQIVGLQQKITLTSFDTGVHTIPAFNLQINQKPLTTVPVAVQVLSVDVSKLANYHPAKEIIPAEKNNEIIYYVLVAVSIIILIVLLFLIFRKQPKKQQKSIVIKPKTWLKQLNELEKLLKQQQYELYLIELEKLSKLVAQQVSGRPFQSVTVKEWQQLLPLVCGDTAIAQKFLPLLTTTETIKFAEQPATEQLCKQATEVVKAFIAACEKQFLSSQKQKHV
ncbi:MAG: hypothetical protein ACOVQE_04290 [Chitinophagaceae bacterium]